MAGVVEEIWRYPLKSAQGESLDEVFVDPDGPRGDRSWACLSSDGMVVSAKNPRRWGRLLFVEARLDGQAVVLHVPGSPPVTGDSPDADRVLSGWLGTPVQVTAVVPAHARLQRLWPSEIGMIPDWSSAARRGGHKVDDIPGAHPGGRFVDFGAVHIVTTQELARLSGEGVDTDVRRFRPNLVLDLAHQPDQGDLIRVGAEVVLRVLIPTPRCAIPGAAQGGVDRAPEVLRALGRQRVDIGGRGRAAAFGFYAEVVASGLVTVGDRSIVLDPVASPRSAR